MFGEYIAEPQDIDATLKEVYNFSMAPFELRDMLVLDIALVVGEAPNQGFIRE